MISFEKLPVGTLNVKDGSVSGVQTKPTPAPHVGISTEELHKQAIELVNDKVPVEKAMEAIDAHDDIKDKLTAKQMVAAVYKIME